MALSGEAFVTSWRFASIWFLTSVRSHVRLEVTLLSKAFVAFRTDEWLLSGVLSEVHMKSGWLGVALTASRICTGVWL